MRHPVDTLRDFSADRRLLILAVMALFVGTTGALAAWALLPKIDPLLATAPDETVWNPALVMLVSIAIPPERIWFPPSIVAPIVVPSDRTICA